MSAPVIAESYHNPVNKVTDSSRGFWDWRGAMFIGHANSGSVLI